MHTQSEQGPAGSPAFPAVFWVANLLEMLERAAFYGFYIAITLYLTDLVGFSDRETGIVAGLFVGLLYFLTPFVGALADRIGFRRALVTAFTMLTAGYTLLGLFTSKVPVVLALVVIAIGSAFIKPLVTGTIAKTVSAANRARGYALFYWVVNIGSFGGKTFVPFIRLGAGLQYVNFFAAGMCLLALLGALLWFRPEVAATQGKTLGEVTRSLVKVLRTPRLILFILIVSGFWTTQYQLYATMPKYVIRLLGESAKPEWIANINPLIVVMFVVLITRLMQHRKAVTSIFIGMLLVPVAAFVIALGPSLQKAVGPAIPLPGLGSVHPMVLMLVVGIALQGFAESFISPRYLEYFSLQSPKGEEGTYLGFAYLYSFFAALAGFVLSGFLLDKYCPDPKTLPAGLSAAGKAVYYQHAHHIWYYFIAIGLCAALALLIFALVTERRSRVIPA
jgi:dipeptide/tripeptide permease